MKKTFSRFVCVLTVILVILSSLFIVPAFADSATISVNKKTINVGDTITVTVGYNSNLSLMIMTGSLSYNSAVLQYVSGADSSSGSTLNFYKELSGQTSGSATVTFKAIAEGSSSLSASMEGSDGNTKGVASSGATVNVTTPAPSSNANLSSLKVSDGTLSPSFSANKTEYTVNVRNGVNKITISANAADGKSTVAGAGTFALKEGDNKYSLTVTSESGAKKSYNVTVHLMTSAETAALDAEQRASDPLLVIYGNKDYHIINDYNGIAVPSNFTTSSTEYKGTAVTTITDTANNYNIYYLKADDDSLGDWFIISESGKFTRLPYLMSGGVMYIVETATASISADWNKDTFKLFDGVNITVYKSSDSRLKDFYVFYGYYNGEKQYFRYDKSEGTIQRYPDFEKTVNTDTKETKQSLFDKIKNFSVIGKIILALAGVAIICIIVILILFIVSNSNKQELPPIEDYYGETETKDFDMVSFSDADEPDITDEIQE